MINLTQNSNIKSRNRSLKRSSKQSTFPMIKQSLVTLSKASFYNENLLSSNYMNRSLFLKKKQSLSTLLNKNNFTKKQ